MRLNSYVIVERAVYEGIVLGLKKLSENPKTNPNEVVETMLDSVMTEVATVIDFTATDPVHLEEEIVELIKKFEQEGTPNEQPTEQ